MDEKLPFTPVKTYRQLSQAEIDHMNAVKEMESALVGVVQTVRRSIHDMIGVPQGNVPDQNSPEGKHLNESMRQIALARTAFEVAFMHLSRAIARPDSPWL